MNTSFLIKDKVKFLQIKQDTIRQKCCQKHKKRDSVSEYVHMKCDTPSANTQLYAFWMTLVAYKKKCNTMSFMLFTGATFVKKNSCLVARIVSFDIAGVHLLTFHILEPYSFKDIELDLSHVISH